VTPETSVVSYCLVMEKQFFGLTNEDVKRMAFQLAMENGILFVKVNTNSIKIPQLLTAIYHIKHFIPINKFSQWASYTVMLFGSKMMFWHFLCPRSLYLYITEVPVSILQSSGRFSGRRSVGEIRDIVFPLCSSYFLFLKTDTKSKCFQK
jgi:hypothetical protein